MLYIDTVLIRCMVWTIFARQFPLDPLVLSIVCNGICVIRGTPIKQKKPISIG